MINSNPQENNHKQLEIDPARLSMFLEAESNSCSIVARNIIGGIERSREWTDNLVLIHDDFNAPVAKRIKQLNVINRLNASDVLPIFWTEDDEANERIYFGFCDASSRVVKLATIVDRREEGSRPLKDPDDAVIPCSYLVYPTAIPFDGLDFGQLVVTSEDENKIFNIIKDKDGSPIPILTGAICRNILGLFDNKENSKLNSTLELIKIFDINETFKKLPSKNPLDRRLAALKSLHPTLIPAIAEAIAVNSGKVVRTKEIIEDVNIETSYRILDNRIEVSSYAPDHNTSEVLQLSLIATRDHSDNPDLFIEIPKTSLLKNAGKTELSQDEKWNILIELAAKLGISHTVWVSGNHDKFISEKLEDYFGYCPDSKKYFDRTYTQRNVRQTLLFGSTSKMGISFMKPNPTSNIPAYDRLVCDRDSGGNTGDPMPFSLAWNMKIKGQIPRGVLAYNCEALGANAKSIAFSHKHDTSQRLSNLRNYHETFVSINPLKPADKSDHAKQVYGVNPNRILFMNGYGQHAIIDNALSKNPDIHWLYGSMLKRTKRTAYSMTDLWKDVCRRVYDMGVDIEPLMFDSALKIKDSAEIKQLT